MAENAAKPFYSVLVLAFVCSALVAGAAVGLRPMQEANKIQDRKKHILYAAGIYDASKSIEELFAPIETQVVELATGEYVTDGSIEPESYNQLKAALSEDSGRPLEKDEDIAKLRYLEKYSLVYLVKTGDQIQQIVLPVRGKGLWSTMYAYVALEGDLTTIAGVSFYQHGETPGLGGEIENPRWQDGWKGKKIYSDTGEIDLQIVKNGSGTADKQMYQIDGLSGATITSRGVDSLMVFWFGDHGYKPFFANLQKDNPHG